MINKYFNHMNNWDSTDDMLDPALITGMLDGEDVQAESDALPWPRPAPGSLNSSTSSYASDQSDPHFYGIENFALPSIDHMWWPQVCCSESPMFSPLPPPPYSADEYSTVVVKQELEDDHAALEANTDFETCRMGQRERGCCSQSQLGATGKAGREATSVRRKAHRQRESKLYPCPYCANVYLRSSHLKVHVRKHTGEKPFQCSYAGCDWRFRRSDELSRHKRCHSGVKPYHCGLCGKSFARSDHLSKHIKVHERNQQQTSSSASPDHESGKQETNKEGSAFTEHEFML